MFVFLVRESRFTCRKTVVVDTHKMGEKKNKKTIHLYTENVCMYNNNNNNNNNTRIEEEEVEGVEAAGEAPKVC